jgi:L-threonylcarbamoyladenylate synthase
VSERRRTIERSQLAAGELLDAAAWIADGGIVAFPTDTFYGLAVDPASSGAVRQLFDLKGRDPAMAVPLVAESSDQVVQAFGPLTGEASRLAQVFWPGPLSLILDAPAWIVAEVHGGRGTAAVRVPDEPIARILAGLAGRPITATSANRTGAPPASDAAGLRWLESDTRVFIIDAGATPGGAPSTLVDARGAELQCIRAGAIAWERVLTSR